MEILASCSRISTFGIRLPQSLSEFSPRRLTVYCRCKSFFLLYVVAIAGKSLHHKDTNHIPNLQHQTRKFNVFNTKLASVSQRKQAPINASKTISYITYHLLLTQNYENMKKRPIFTNQPLKNTKNNYQN